MKSHMLLALLGFILVQPVLFGQTNAPNASEDLQQLTMQLQRSPSDEALCEKIINLVKTMDPPPPLPEETARRMARGIAAFKDSKSVSDYKDAVVEFEKATLVAPWYADAYYNLGQARAKAEDYAGASASLKLYLLAAPGAKDAADAKTLMYEMEYKQEKANKEQSAVRANAQRLADAQRLVETFRGAWYGAQCYVGKMSIASLTRGCTGPEAAGKNWYDFKSTEGFQILQFEIENDGTVKMNGMSVWAGCEGDVFGIPQGASFHDIRWELRPKDGPRRQIWSSIQNDGSSLRISCNRPVSGGDATVPYRYVWWTRTP